MGRELLPLEVSGAWLAVHAAQVQEILGRHGWVPIPGARAELPGVLGWRGQAVAVVDLAAIAGIGAPLPPGEGRERTVIVQVGSMTVALLADGIREVRLFSEADLRAPRATHRRYASQEVELDGSLVPILDVSAIVTAVSPGGEAAA